MAEPAFSIEEVSNPHDIARARAQDERHRRNSDWLQTHWGDVLPQARGKFLAVAGQEPFIADTPEAAWAWVATYASRGRWGSGAVRTSRDRAAYLC